MSPLHWWFFPLFVSAEEYWAFASCICEFESRRIYYGTYAERGITNPPAVSSDNLFQEMRPETMEMLARGLPLWQRLLLPMLGAGVLNDHLRIAGSVSANMRIVERTFG